MSSKGTHDHPNEMDSFSTVEGLSGDSFPELYSAAVLSTLAI